MKAKNIFPLHLLYLILCFPLQTSAQNWYPLEVGNKWQYFHQVYYYHTPWPILMDVEIYGDTIINGKNYYWEKLTSTGYSHWEDLTLIHYDLENKMICIYDFGGDSVYISMDFNLPAGSKIEIPSQIGCSRKINEGNDHIFGMNFRYKGYTTYDCGPSPSYKESRFAVGLGKYYEYGWNHVMGFGEYESDSYLIQSIINIRDSIEYHSHQYLPQIYFTPPTSISDSLFQIFFIVDHYYSRIYLPFQGNDTLLLNYIDSVIVDSYYSNGVAIVYNKPIIVSNIPNEKKYLVDTYLNLDLLTNGYNYYYRIKAVDKGIIPHTTYLPSSDYYEIVFDTTTDVNDIHNFPISFKLYQNYPNPFNPTTTITYTIPTPSESLPLLKRKTKEGFVKLKVYDILGNEVATLVNEEKPAGEYKVKFDGSNLPSGIYFYQLKAGNFIQTKKMILLR